MAFAVAAASQNVWGAGAVAVAGGGGAFAEAGTGFGAFGGAGGFGGVGGFGGFPGVGGFPGGCQRPHHHHHRHHHHEEGPEAPQRNPFLDFLTAPGQALGLKGGNQNDKNYDRYMEANQAGNMLKGF